jgi:hypothetical protein
MDDAAFTDPRQKTAFTRSETFGDRMREGARAFGIPMSRGDIMGGAYPLGVAAGAAAAMGGVHKTPNETVRQEFESLGERQ